MDTYDTPTRGRRLPGRETTWEGLNSELRLNTRPVTMSISSFFSSLVAGTLHADAPEESKVSEAEPQEEEVAGETEASQEEEEPEDVRFLILPGVGFSSLSLDAPVDPSRVA